MVKKNKCGSYDKFIAISSDGLELKVTDIKYTYVQVVHNEFRNDDIILKIYLYDNADPLRVSCSSIEQAHNIQKNIRILSNRFK